MPLDLAALGALAWGALASIGLVLGAVAGTFWRLSHATIALVMSVGAGLLLAAASLELAADAIRLAGPLPVVVVLLTGAAMVSAAGALLARLGAAARTRCGECVQQPSEAQQPGSRITIALGTAIDAIPEALVLGLALRAGPVPAELLIAIAIGNVPEALSGAAGMQLAGRSHRYILLLWGAIAAGATLLTVVGYAASGLIDPAWTPLLKAFGAGALLAMIAETMIPEAFHGSPRFSGLVVAVGFCLVLLVASPH